MAPVQPITKKTRIVPTEDQKMVLRKYRQQFGMISGRQHDLISKCHIESGLPVTFIRSWIGNQNAQQRCKRKGGSQYRPKGKPRRLSAYNLFCSECKVPDAVRALGWTAQNKWWSDQWKKASKEVKAAYEERARKSSKENSTECLEGDALCDRKMYLTRKLGDICGELSLAGVYVAGYMVEEGQEEAYAGCDLGINFLKSRRAKSLVAFNDFRNYLQHVNEEVNLQKGSLSDGQSATQAAVYSTNAASPPQSQLAQTVTSTQGHPTSTQTPIQQNLTNDSLAPHEEEVVANRRQEDMEHSQEYMITGSIANTGKAVHTPGNQETAMDILLPISNGTAEGSQENILKTGSLARATEVGSAHLTFVAPQHNGSTTTSSKRGPARRKRKPDPMTGRIFQRLWIMDGSTDDTWFQGTILERSGKGYNIKYDDSEDIDSLTIADLRKGLRANTIRLV